MTFKDIRETMEPIVAIAAVVAVLYVVHLKIQESKAQQATGTQLNYDDEIAQNIMAQGQEGNLNMEIDASETAASLLSASSVAEIAGGFM